MSEDRCVMCGAIIPEGRMVCPNCEKEKPMKCNHPIWSPVCSFHYNGECLREHNYECPALVKPMKNLSHGEMVQLAEGKRKQPPRFIDANKLIDMAMHEGAYGYVDVHDIQNTPTADVVERKKGKWIVEGHHPNYLLRCSACKEIAMWAGGISYIYPNFCPACGADMRGDGNDN